MKRTNESHLHVVSTRHPLGRMKMTPTLRFTLWVLRVYVLLMVGLVAYRFLHAL